MTTTNKELIIKKAVEEFDNTGVFPNDNRLLDDTIYHYQMVVEYSYAIPEFGLVRTELTRQLIRFKAIKEARNNRK